MPTPSEFEEKEFETKLSPELATGPGEFWTPGQVLEHRTGAEIFVEANNVYFEVVGEPYRTGPLLSEPLLWAFITQRWPRAGSAPPDFRANVLLQVKRSHRYAVRQGSLGYPCWKFEIDPVQQVRLEAVELYLSSRAVVSYAAPAFNSRADLFKHARSKELTAHTTFPSPSKLTGHSRWQYDSGGATGVAHSVPEDLTEVGLRERAQLLLRKQDDAPEESKPRELVQQLDLLWNSLKEATTGDEGNKQLRNDLLTIASEVERIGETPLAISWARVAAAVRLLGLSWLVVGAHREGAS